MKITLGGVKKEVAQETTIAQLMEQEALENPQYITVSVNETFLDPEEFASFVLKENEEVEFLYFMGGGC